MLETDLPALRAKYERMLGLRIAHARARNEPDFVEADPRAAMGELARDFPGALRELDELSIEVIRERIRAISAAETDPLCTQPWMGALVSFHRLARGALAAKRWLGGRPWSPGLAGAFALALPTLLHGEDAAAWRTDLAAIGKPPRGRVMDLVHARLAHELGTDVQSARLAVLPPPRSGRRP